MTQHMIRRRGRSGRLLATSLALIVLLSAAGAGAIAAPALAQDDEPPALPAAYYGEVLIDGEPAPEGTLVTAYVGGEKRGSISVGADGQFGRPAIGEEKLEVPGDSEDASEPVTFRVNGQTVDAEPAVTWASSDLQEVTLSGSDIGERSYQVSIDDEESTTEIQPNDSATVAAVVENTGEVTTPTTVEFSLDGGDFDGDVVGKRTIEGLAPGETTTIPFAVRLDDEGEYEATVDLIDFGSATTTITVDEDAGSAPGPSLPPAPSDPSEPNLQVTAATLSDSTVAVGASVTAEGTIENLGEAEGTATVSLAIDGEAVASEEVTLKGGATTAVSFEHTFEEAGTYEVSVGGTTAGTVTVEEPSGDGEDGEDGTDDGEDGEDGTDGADGGDDDSIPGFGAIAALIATLALAGRRIVN
ncbi:CARDB domain-containing protein [Halovivax limisalsi]|uniref:CARDB domain-containing protein n=1 Tax=Halovivax limisalsi TaxID=1453760 RepID=UPI001FFD8E1E|nr:CARDB domain-containing protein [Halovivax limisalsi]